MARTKRAWFRAAAPAVAVIAAGCGLRARTALDEAPGIDRAGLAAMLADGGISVGGLRTAVLPDGTTVAIVVPEPSDGYPPQVSVLRLDGGEPALETEAVCDPFVWASMVTGDLFYGLEPARIEAVAWGRWGGGERKDLVIDVATEVAGGGAAYGGAAGAMVGRCVFRLLREPDLGPVTAAILPHLVRADSTSEYAGRRTDIVEEHAARAVEGEADQVDFTVTTTTTECFRTPGTGTVCAPRTESVTRRFALSGEGRDAMFVPLEDTLYGGYGGGYRGYGGLGTTVDGPGYDDTATGYDDGTATGYDDTATGYDDGAAGYDEIAVPE